MDVEAERDSAVRHWLAAEQRANELRQELEQARLWVAAMTGGKHCTRPPWGWCCDRVKWHSGPCATQPRWWNIRGRMQVRPRPTKGRP